MNGKHTTFFKAALAAPLRGRSHKVVALLAPSKMKRIFLCLMLATSALCDEPRGPFYSPITGFSEALMPTHNG